MRKELEPKKIEEITDLKQQIPKQENPVKLGFLSLGLSQDFLIDLEGCTIIRGRHSGLCLKADRKTPLIFISHLQCNFLYRLP